MIKSYINAFITLTMIISICFLFTVSSFANYGDIFLYNENGIKQLTESEYSPGQPQINNSGEVVWSASNGPEYYWDYGIFYYNGTTITSLTSGNYRSSPQINDVGDVVWVQEVYITWMGDILNNNKEIFYYDGENTIRLTNNYDDDNDPQINNSGEVVWIRFDGIDNEIFYYDGIDIVKLTDNDYDDDSPQINDCGETVWVRHDVPWKGLLYDYYDLNTSEIFYYDGANIIQLTDNDYYDACPQINDSGEVVWSGSDGHDKEIFYYDGANIIKVTDNDYDDNCPQINDSGEIFWIGNPPGRSNNEIYFYDGMDIIQLTDNYNYKDSLQINNSGEAVWRMAKGSGYEIFYYDGIDIVQLTDNDYNEIGPRINDSGDIVWYTSVITDPDFYLPDFNSGDESPILSPRRIEIPKTWSWSTGSSGGGCLISTAAYGFRMPKKSLALALIVWFLLISFAVSRKKL